MMTIISMISLCSRTGPLQASTKMLKMFLMMMEPKPKGRSLGPEIAKRLAGVDLKAPTTVKVRGLNL